MQKGSRGTKVENNNIAWKSTDRISETTVEHQQAQLARAKQSRRNTNTQGRTVCNPKE
jgi:hypothetical protein